MKEGKTFVIGDIHGSHKGLVQCLERSGFDNKVDTLISLGDIVDGWSETFECVEELLKIKNLISIRGNHDAIFFYWLTRGVHMFGWVQGANHVAESYIKHSDREDIFIKPANGAYITNLTKYDVPLSHFNFFKSQIDFHIDKKNRGFVHGGFTNPRGLGYEDGDTYHWDRELWDYYSLEVSKGGSNFQCFAHEEVFIGHTPVLSIGKTTPVTRGRVTNMDTGGGWIGGRVSIMDVDTHEFWQSDLSNELYPNENPRK